MQIMWLMPHPLLHLKKEMKLFKVDVVKSQYMLIG